ncbi:peptidoglycan-binding protein [Shinella sp. M27]|uniref:peptidoglycan-binding protein n=1 Tax=Shinella sp. M27 TaxID=3368614 RepID=UPI003B9E5BF4
MNRTAFYAALRGGAMFPKGLNASQVDGVENLLDVWARYFADDALQFLAYDLATAFHETAATMQPIKERGAVAYFSKYEPGTKLGKMLGNTVAGDGYRFRGEGHVQNTGRRNARHASDQINKRFDLKIDLVANPEQRGDPFVSAISLFLGNREGWWTGRDLDDFIDGIDEATDEDLREYIAARRVVNGTDKAAKIAGHAIEFGKALKVAGYAPAAGAPVSSAKERVKWLQSRLTAHGFPCGPIDGYRGSLTDKAVLAFETARGIKIDIVDSATAAALDVAA